MKFLQKSLAFFRGTGYDRKDSHIVGDRALTGTVFHQLEDRKRNIGSELE